MKYKLPVIVAVVLALLTPNKVVEGGKDKHERPLDHIPMYITHRVPLSKLRKAPPWWGLWKMYNPDKVFNVIKPFRYERDVEKRLRMPKSVKWKPIDEYKNMVEVENTFWSQKFKKLNPMDYLEKNPPKVYNLPKYDNIEIALLRKAGLYEAIDMLDNINEIIETGTLKKDTSLLVLTRKVYENRDGPLLAVYASDGLDVKVLPKKDTTIYLREAGELKATKYTLIITYDTLNPYVYYNSPLGFMHRLRWDSHEYAYRAWAQEKWLDYLRVIAAFSGYVEACHHRDEIIAWRDSLQREIQRADSLIHILEEKIEKYGEKSERGKELLVRKWSLKSEKDEDEKQLKVIRGLLKYRLTEEKCKDYLSEDYMRYFTRGGVVSVFIPVYYRLFPNEFVESWNNKTYWKGKEIIKPRIISPPGLYHLSLYGAIRYSFLTTTSSTSDTIIVYIFRGRQIRDFFYNHLLPY